MENPSQYYIYGFMSKKDRSTRKIFNWQEKDLSVGKLLRQYCNLENTVSLFVA